MFIKARIFLRPRATDHRIKGTVKKKKTYLTDDKKKELAAWFETGSQTKERNKENYPALLQRVICL